MREPLGGNVHGISARWQRYPLSLLSVLAPAACGLFASGPSLSIEMDATVVVRPKPDTMATVTYVIVNHGSAAAYVAACGLRPSPATDRLVGAAWEGYFGNGCKGTVDMSPITLTPGQTVNGTWSWDRAGTYRLRVYYGEDPTSALANSVVGPNFALQ